MIKSGARFRPSTVVLVLILWVGGPYHGWDQECATVICIYVRPSKLVTCLNDNGCFEGVPSLATVLASFEASGIATRHRHAFAK